MYRFCLPSTLLLMLSLVAPAYAADKLFMPCEIGNATTGLLSAECRTVTVAEDPNDPAGAKIDLYVARVPARSRERRDDPLILLAGGPGQAATSTFPSVVRAFEKLLRHRDIYLIDQRGTGQSNRLDCPEPIEENDLFVFDAAVVEAQTRNCLAQLTGNPRFYTTSIAVQDLEHVRNELGINRWNVYGISYGTRVGLHYLRQYPDRIRTLILDAVVPPDVSLGESIAFDAQRALELMLKRCSNTPECATRFPNLEKTTLGLLASLRKSPKAIQFENFNSGKLTKMQFTLDHLTLTMRMLTYSSHGVSLLPVLLTDAFENDNFAPLARQSYLQAEKLSESLATAMHNSVVCTEDQPFVILNAELIERLESTYLGSIPVKALASSCKYWPVGFMDENFKEPVKSDKPVLILSGEADPVTPPAYGDSIARHLPNALHIINPGQGHMQAHLGCMPTVMSNFVERGNADDVDYGCLERQQPEPFFVDANGPMP